MKVITLANLAESSPQEVFDHIVAHGRRQMEKAIQIEGDKENCVYRTADGKACFAGCCMSNDEYALLNQRHNVNSNTPEIVGIEGTTWAHLSREGYVPTAHVDLIVQMQLIHDGNKTNVWEHRFAEIARTLNLKFDPLY